ncbi:MAG: hypothetical protein ACI9VI_002981 [Candidatus Azotimanducaceae bacterium]|jgi:hypothetical protein
MGKVLNRFRNTHLLQKSAVNLNYTFLSRSLIKLKALEYVLPKLYLLVTSC